MSDVAEDFASSLSDLTVNSKPHINMLTMLAEENIEFAPVITQTVLNHLQKVPPEIKLPVLYLIDSIVKNVGKAYIDHFTKDIVQHFTDTFEKVDEKTREQMFKVRQTWSDLFSPKTIYALDAKVHQIDPAWPCSAPPSTVHLNPKFFKSDVIDSKSLTSTKFQLEPQSDNRSRHRKSKPQYSPRTSSMSHSSRSRKASPTSTTSNLESSDKAVGPEALREQMILKQKKLLELQKKKLELELMETKAKLDEQQKQLKQTSSHKGTSSQLAKIQKKVSQEEAQLKLMGKNLKKQVAKNAPKLQEIHRATIDMKSQKLSDVGKLSAGPESLVKPAALLELESKPVKSVAVPAQPTLKILPINPTLERHKQIVAADSTEEIGPPPVRITPVSKQLINAALSCGRNVRDPRIRQMTSRLETQLNMNTMAPPLMPPPPTPQSSSIPTPTPIAVSKKLSPPQDPRTKHKKDKKTSKEQDKSPKKSEEESKHHSRYSSRKSDKSPIKNKSEKLSPSKKSEEKKDRRSKLEEPFSPPRSKSPENVITSIQKIQSPTKVHSKRDQSKITESEPTNKADKTSKFESSPKRAKFSDTEPDTESRGACESQVKQYQSLKLDVEVAQSVRPDELSRSGVSPELNSSADLYDDDIDKIVKNPIVINKLSDMNIDKKISKIEKEFQDSAKFSDDSVDEKFDYDIIRNPTKYMTSDKTIILKEQQKERSEDEQQITINEEHKFTINEDKKKQLASIFDMPDKESVKTLQNREVLLDNIPESKSTIDYIVKEDKCIPIVESDVTSKRENCVSETPEPGLHVEESEKTNFNHALKSEDKLDLENSPLEVIKSSNFSSTSISSKKDGFRSVDHEPTTMDTKEIDHTLEHTETKSVEPVLHTAMLDTLHINNSSELSDLPISNNLLEITPFSSDPIVENTAADDTDKKTDSLMRDEKKSRKGEKPSIMEQLIADAESHEASPSPPPPPVISDKFKEIKQSSLSRLRRVGRPREDLDGSESPETTDVDLRPQITAPLINDQKNEVIGLAEKDVDLRNLPSSPTKKRPSMEKLLDAPPAKKSKAEVMDELFGSEDVDLRPVLCPPPPSPPPPPRISSPPGDTGGEKLWARYKQTRPDTYKSKYTPSPRDRAASVDRFGRLQRFPSTSEGGGRNRTFSEDVDMRTQAVGVSQEDRYNLVIMQAMEQHKRGDLNAEEYKRVLSEVVSMREKHQLQEAQRRDEEEAAQITEELTEPISDDDISGGSLSGIENAPSPTESYSGGEDNEEPSDKATTIEKETVESKGDVDIRRLPADVDIRMKIHRPRPTVDEINADEKSNHTMRALSPYSRKALEKEKYRSRKEELKAQRREKSRRADERRQAREEREPRYRKSRFSQEPWDSREDAGTESMDVDAPRVPPLPHFPSTGPPHLNIPHEQLEPTSRLQPPPGPGWNNIPRMPSAGPGPGPWAPPPLVRGPTGLMLRPQDRFMHLRWRPPGPGPVGEPGPRFNRFGPPGPARFPGTGSMPPVEIPPSDPAVLKMIEEDPTKCISIDGMSRDIRYYGINAVAFMAWDDPREVTFQPGHRRVFIDDRESLVLHFNAPPLEMVIDGQPHRLRLGAPTRELYIDNQWHEVFFGAPPVPCKIGGQTHMVQLEGPPPQVRPGVQRRDLVVGRIMLIIDAELFFPIFLDAKPQRFEVLGVAYIIRFVEALQTTVINGVPFKSDFGGLPKAIILNGKKHFFRLSELPRGVIPGYLNILTMEGGRLPSPPPQALPAPPLPPQLPNSSIDFNDNKPDPFLQPPMSIITAPRTLSPEMTSVHPSVSATASSTTPAVTTQPPLQPKPQQQPTAVNTLDMLTSLMPGAEPSRSMEYSYTVDNENSNPSVPVITSSAPLSASGPAGGVAASGGEVNVAELLQKLMATGIMPSLAPSQPKDRKPAAEKPAAADSVLIKPVDFRKPDSLKTRQPALISHLYSGIQCNSCGVRFPPEQTMKYSQHLDWHFRQNRRDRDSSRTAQSRRYYYDVNDWVQFEEIEDLEERAQPWFEMQEGGEEEPPPPPLASVCAAAYPEEASCVICHDKFESFYNEEKEEWHLRNALDHEGSLVHPLCLEDQKAAAEKPIILDDIDITGDDNEVTEVKEDEKTGEDKKEEEEEVKEVAKAEEDDDILEVKDLEVIPPVFPVEDLTVSDSEDVADDEKPKSKDKVITIEEKEKPEETEAMDTTTDSQEEKEENKDDEEETLDISVRDESSQDDLIMLEKGENSILSNDEIMEVVKNIKKDPDALGGEFEDVGDEAKKDKGAVPVPAPVVDTTHASVTSLIDGNVEFEETPQQINAGGPSKIKINITKAIMKQPTNKEKDTKDEYEDIKSPEALTEEEVNPQRSKLSIFNQPPPPGEEFLPQNMKPALYEIKDERKEFPMVSKGTELSGLCSIM